MSPFIDERVANLLLNILSSPEHLDVGCAKRNAMKKIITKAFYQKDLDWLDEYEERFYTILAEDKELIDPEVEGLVPLDEIEP